MYLIKHIIGISLQQKLLLIGEIFWYRVIWLQGGLTVLFNSGPCHVITYKYCNQYLFDLE